MKSDSKKIFEIVGNLSVVASLLFVGMQLYLDRQIAAAEQYQFRAESRKADLRVQLESDAYIARRVEAWKAGIRPIWWNEEHDLQMQNGKFSETSVATFIIMSQLELVHFDNIYFQYNQGLIEEEFWQRALIVIEDRLTNDPIAREIWLNDVLRPVSDLAKEIVLEPNYEQFSDLRRL